jgi:hypothetical protein
VRRRHRRARRLGAAEQSIDRSSARNEVAKAELAALRRSRRHGSVLCELGARVEREHHPAGEREQDDRAGGMRLAVQVVGADHPGGLQAEPVPVKRECPLKVGHRQRDHIHARVDVPTLLRSDRGLGTATLVHQAAVLKPAGRGLRGAETGYVRGSRRRAR